ncbi:MAG: pilus assembly protein PilO [Proteobacteria bacterium]|nr:MAG: pilus assembly protein PilO [Pseudomonadota bacterium]
MTLSDLNNLSFDNIGSWPVPIKIAFITIICTGILGLGYWKDVSVLQKDLQKVEAEEVDLRITFEGRQKKAANLNALKQQLEDIKETFGDLLKRLPNKTEVAALLVDISQQGLGAGLEFVLFKPGKEQPADFYIELPIRITVVGQYHQFGKFISGVSDLPRIVTNHNVNIKPKGDGKLILETTAKTYRYLDDEEEAGQ